MIRFSGASDAATLRGLEAWNKTGTYAKTPRELLSRRLQLGTMSAMRSVGLNFTG